MNRLSEAKPGIEAKPSITTALRRHVVFFSVLILAACTPEKSKTEVLLEKLPEIVSPYAEVSQSPKVLRSDKPLLILVAEMHGMDEQGILQDGVRVQEDVVQIFHRLREHTSLTIQCIESFPAQTPLETKVQEGMSDDLRETTGYIESLVEPMRHGGAVISAPYMIEDLYGDRVLSVGVESNFEKIANFFQDRAFVQAVTSERMMEARARILPRLAEYWKIPAPTTREGVVKFYATLKKNYAALTLEERMEVDQHILQDAWLAQVLDVASRYFYDVIVGRNHIMAEELRRLLKGKENLFFSVGAQHVGHLTRLMPDENIIVLRPRGLTIGYDHPSEQFQTPQGIYAQTKKELWAQLELLTTAPILWNAPR